MNSNKYIVDLIEHKIHFESNKYRSIYNYFEFTKEYNSKIPFYFENKNKKNTYFCYNVSEKIEELKLIFSDNIILETDKSIYN